MYQKLLSTLTSIIFVSLALCGQTDSCQYQIEGRVYDAATKEPLIGANVVIEGNGRATTTDLKGVFIIGGLCPKEFDLTISYLGYKTITHHHDYHHPRIEVMLAAQSELLESVIIEEKTHHSSIKTTTVATLKKEKLDLLSTENLGSVLSNITGVSMVKTGQNIVLPMIHGLSGNRIMIIKNDVKHEYQNWDESHAPEIDPQAYDQVEVIKGAGTVRYGPDALGGVVLLNPRQVELSSPWRGRVNMTGKSNGRASIASFSLAKGSKWLTMQARGSYTRQGDLSAPNYQLTNTGMRENSQSINLRAHINSNWDILFTGSRISQELGILRGAVNGNLLDLEEAIGADIPNETSGFSYQINSPKQKLNHHTYKAELRYLDNQQAAHLRYSFQQNDRQEFDIRRGNNIDIPNIDVILNSHIIDTDWSHPSLAKGLKGKIGMQYIFKQNSNQPGTNTIPFIPNYNSNTIGVFAIETYTTGKHLFEVGIRYDYFNAKVSGRTPSNSIFRNEIIYQNFSGVLGYTYHHSDHLTYSTNFGTAWRPPNIGELYRYGRRGTFIEYGMWRYKQEENTLSATEVLTQAERNVSSEVGYKWVNTISIKKEKFSAEFTGYLNYMDNFIYTRPAGVSSTVRGAAPLFIYDQTDALFLGADASIAYSYSDKWKTAFGFNYVYGDQIDRSSRFAGIPPTRFNYDLSYSPQVSYLDKCDFTLGFQYQMKQNLIPRIISIGELLRAEELGIELFGRNAEDFDILDSPDAFLLTNITWQAQRGKIKWYLQVQNLFNSRYRQYTDRIRYYADDIGRNFIVGMTLQI